MSNYKKVIFVDSYYYELLMCGDNILNFPYIVHGIIITAQSLAGACVWI